MRSSFNRLWILISVVVLRVHALSKCITMSPWCPCDLKAVLNHWHVLFTWPQNLKQVLRPIGSGQFRGHNKRNEWPFFASFPSTPSKPHCLAAAYSYPSSQFPLFSVKVIHIALSRLSDFTINLFTALFPSIKIQVVCSLYLHSSL